MTEKLLRIREVSQITGIPEMSVYVKVRSGILPCVRFGRSIRIKEKDLMKYIEENRKK